MLKKSITYEDYNGQTVTEDFYFNLTLLELLESDLEVGGFEALVERLTKTQDAKEAYGLFKDLVLSAYGEKSDDGRRFVKSDELRKGFESSPAMSELIVGFLQHPEEGATFLESVVPAKMIAEAKAAQAAKEASTPVTETTTPILEAPVDNRPKWLIEDREPTAQELQNMPREELLLAMQRKNRVKE